jgi:hypothetical protein
MAQRLRTLFDGAVPGTNLGGAFTASLAERQVLPQAGESYFDSLFLSYKGVGAVAIVNLRAFLDLVNPFVWKDGQPRIQMQGRDLFAFSTAWYGGAPRTEEGAIAANDWVSGMQIPLWAKIKPNETYSWFATRVAVTNISTEVLRLTIAALEKIPAGGVAGSLYAPGEQSSGDYAIGRGRIDARTIPVTLPAATGISTIINKLPKLGRLLGLLVFNTKVPDRTTDTSSIQRLFIDSSKFRVIDAHWQDLSGAMPFRPDPSTAAGVDSPVVLELDNFGWLDLRQEPIDLIADDYSVTADVGVASDPVRITPIIEVPQ